MENMKITALLMAALMLAGVLAGCGESNAAQTAAVTTEAAAETVTETVAETAAEKATGSYTLYNVTGEKITELYLYETSSEKGGNLAADGFRNNKKMAVTYEGTADTTLTLEYVTESGASAKFETLHIEEVPIALSIVDAASGATPISFGIPEDTGSYKLVNTTGAVVTELYVYPNGGDRGENLAGEGLADGASVDFSYTGAVDTSLTVEFKTEGGETMRFETLHIETVTINLLAADAMTGATPIQFGY